MPDTCWPRRPSAAPPHRGQGGHAASADLLGQLDDDSRRAADVAEPVGVPVAQQLADELRAAGLQAGKDVVEDIHSVVVGLRARGAVLVGELVNYENSYWLCYVRGPAGIIVELAEKIG